MRETTESPDMFRKRLQELYTQHHQHVQRACKRYVQNREDADDLAVEVLMKAAQSNQNRHEPGIGHPRTWLYRVACNHCVDYLRRRNWRLDRLQLYASEQSPFRFTEPAVDPLDPFDPVDRTETLPAEWRRVLTLLRRGLSSEERRILHLLFDAGMRQEGVARITGVSRGTVARKMARIRGRALEIRLALRSDPFER